MADKKDSQEDNQLDDHLKHGYGMVLLIDTLNQNRQEEIPRQSQKKKSTLRLTSNLEFQIQIQESKSKLIFRYCVLEGS